MTKEDTLKILNLIENVYPLVTMKSETVLRWMVQCESMDYSLLLKNLALHMRKQPYPPVLNELLENANNEGANLEWLDEYSFRP
ncbi:hypothetical protein [Mesobacillus jeotgali]|uniref:hypothetical protein n=1 Tax=Mesobacillus jeotgali TaxID=129985 RepID=UPI00177D526D|nr:hypothetical protein [Mesobacillus jeotgali]UYZ20115.1 hypothetical protein FOF60_13560 [Mesobacillus jeotgali]